MEVLVAKLKKTKTNRKLLVAHAFTVAVATCRLVIVLGRDVRVCSPKAEDGGGGLGRRRWRLSGESPVKGK